LTTEVSDERPLRVLVADDHPTNRAVLEVILGLIAADLVSVEDGAQALAAFKNNDFDIVLMDLQMPVMDGFEAIREIRKFEAEMQRRRTPILAVSANAMSEHISASRAAGADQHIAKPVVPDALLQAMADKLAAAAEAAGPRTHIVVGLESCCAAAPLIVDAHADLRIGSNVVRPPGAPAMLRDHPDAAVVGAAGERNAARLAGLGAGGLQFHHQR